MYQYVLGTKCKKSRAYAHFFKKIIDIQADTLGIKRWEKGLLLLLGNQVEEKY